MIYKILTIFAIIGLGAAAVLPSDLIEHKAPGQIVVLSGADPKIFKNPDMKLAPLGPPHFQSGDMSFVDHYLKAARDWLNQTPPLTPSI